MTIDVKKLPYNLAMKIKFERMKRGLAQEKLAEIADLSRSTLSKIERGNSYPTLDTIAKIANALELSFEDIFNFTFLNY